MHNREAREHGEAQGRLDVLAGWHEVPSMLTEREQSALVLTESIIRIVNAGLPRPRATTSKALNEQETVRRLVMAVTTINVEPAAVSTHQQPPTAS